jgi:hypothetical protein
VVQMCKAQVCDVLSIFCNHSKSLQESTIYFFCLVFLDDTTAIFVTL